MSAAVSGVPAEAAAQAMYDSVRDRMHFPTDWDGAPEPLRQSYRDMAVAALPSLREQIADEVLGPVRAVAISFEDFEWSAVCEDEVEKSFARGYEAAMRRAGAELAEVLSAHVQAAEPERVADDSMRECIVNVAWTARQALARHENGYRNAAIDGIEQIIARIPKALIREAQRLVPSQAAEEVGGE